MPNKPWNDDRPVSYAEMWIGANECKKHIRTKMTGDENTDWLPYCINHYIIPAMDGDGVKHRESYPSLLLGSSEGHMEKNPFAKAVLLVKLWW